MKNEITISSGYPTSSLPRLLLVKRVLHISSCLFLFLLFSCNSAEVKDLKSSIIDYADLPSEVKAVMFVKDHTEKEGNISLNLFRELNEFSKYDYLSKRHPLLPWVYDGELVRKSDNKRYKLDLSTDHGTKYIVHHDYLYVPRHYNLQEKDSLNYTFSRFKLD